MPDASGKDMLWRDYMAAKMLGRVIAKTSGEYLDHATKTGLEGWVYVGRHGLVFIADVPIWERSQGGTNDERILYMTYLDLGTSLGLLATRGAPNAIVSFGNGMEFMGAKRQMKRLHKLARR